VGDGQLGSKNCLVFFSDFPILPSPVSLGG
jgi:hypothetical protein